MSYKIKTVSEMIDVPKNTLIAWERRFGFPRPDRLPNGYRVYSEADLVALRALKKLLDDGLRISEAMEQVGGGTQPHTIGPRAVAPARLCDAFLEAALAFRRREALDVLNTSLTLPMRVVLDEIFLPILHEVGRAWTADEISVSQEHFISVLVRERMIAMFAQLEGGPDRGAHAVCVGFPSEYHELGLLAVAIRLALGGCHVTYLGPAVPMDDVIRFAIDNRPAWICVSLIQAWPATAVREYVHAVSAQLPENTRLALGGPGLPSIDAPESVVLSQELEGLRPHGLL